LFGRPASNNSINSNSINNSSLQDEMLIYHQRRLETLETEKLELNHDLDRSKYVATSCFCGAIHEVKAT
jgi:hypothetical protein